MYKPKVGDKVRVIDEYQELEYGSVHTVKEVSHQAGTLNLGDCFWWNFSLFELVKENNMFDLKTQPWFIRTPTPEISEAVQLWLFEQGIGWQYPVGEKVVQHTDSNFLMISSYTKDCFCHTSSIDPKYDHHKEIKLTVKTVVDTVEYPTIESEQDIKLRELKETIAKAQEQIDILLENGK